MATVTDEQRLDWPSETLTDARSNRVEGSRISARAGCCPACLSASKKPFFKPVTNQCLTLVNEGDSELFSRVNCQIVSSKLDIDG